VSNRLSSRIKKEKKVEGHLISNAEIVYVSSMVMLVLPILYWVDKARLKSV
jgi:hypothetical protein